MQFKRDNAHRRHSSLSFSPTDELLIAFKPFVRALQRAAPHRNQGTELASPYPTLADVEDMLTDITRFHGCHPPDPARRGED